MAKRKKAKAKKARESESLKDGDSAEGLFLDLCLNSIAELEGDDVGLEAQGPTDPLLDELSTLVLPEELEILRLSGAFGDVKLKLGENGAENIEHKQYDRHAMGGATASATARFRAPPPPVPIFAEFPGKGSSMALASELRYLQTVLQPAEMRWLVAELACDLLEDAPVTHTDISDAVIASIAPSTAQKVAFQADAQYKYTTAQFLQVYMKMRHVVLEHKLLLGGARADALVLALAPFARDIGPVGPEDEVAVSAVEALRQIMDSEDMLR